jgi:hypothetical protein
VLADSLAAMTEWLAEHAKSLPVTTVFGLATHLISTTTIAPDIAGSVNAAELPKVAQRLNWRSFTSTSGRKMEQ